MGLSLLTDGCAAIVLVKVNLMSRTQEVDDGSEPLLTIGEMAERVQRRPSAIRYYEEIGLLPEPIRVNGRRRYRTGTVRTLAVIETGRRRADPRRDQAAHRSIPG
jgi:hypothetical protein